MSATIDERVLEMRFDNKHFESNVSTTMSTLDKLKQKLNLTGAAKGLENVSDAARKVDLSGVSNGAETVGLKFNAMYTMADQALRNITNSAMAAGKRIISALTIDPVKTGFSEYETQINATQTILANTESKGTTIDDVNEALAQLNAYADKTIYNFTEMTRNIGTFTAAGIDLNTSVNAIQGIANLAAVSGSTSQQASTAMYQLSQALASGTVKLMDWNSVVNAGMGGQVFQDALKETARVHGVAIDAMIEEEGSFRETLKSGWITSEILTETLQKFTLTTEGLTEEQIKANREMLRAKGYTEDQIDGIFKLGNTATDAATKVKTFTQLWDVLKEAAQSGWAQTWKIVVGDFEKAKALLTPLADGLTGFINRMSEWRNILLDAVFNSPPFVALIDKINNVTKAVETVTKATADYGKVVDEIINGDWGNGQTRWDKLAEAGYDWAHAQNLVNEKLGCSIRHATDYTESQADAAKATATTVEALLAMSDAELQNIGFTKEEIKQLHLLKEVAEKTGYSIKDILEDPSKLSGRSLLIESFKDIGKVLGDIAKAIGAAWEAIFNPMGKTADEKMGERVDAFYDLLLSFREWTRNLAVDGDKLTRTFKGVFAILDLVTSVVGGGFKIAFKIISTVLSYFNLDILDVTAVIGDAVVAFHDWIESMFDVTKILDIIVPWIQKAYNWIKELCQEIAKTDEFKTFAKNISSVGTAIGKLLDKIVNSKSLNNFISGIKYAAAMMFNFLSGIAQLPGVKNFISFITDSAKAIGDWIAGIKDADDVTKYVVKGIVTALLSCANVLWDTIVGLGGYIVEGLVKGITNGAGSLWDAIVKIGSYIVEAIKEYFGIHSPSTVMIAIGGFLIAGLVEGLNTGKFILFKTVTDVCGDLLGFVQDLVVSLKNLDFGTVLAGVLTGGIIVATVKVADAIQNFSNAFGGFGDMLEEVGDMCKAFGKGVKNYLNAKAVQSLAISIAILVGSLIAITFIPSDRLWEAVGVLAALTGIIAVLTAVAIGLSKLGSVGDSSAKNVAGPLLAIAATITLLAITMKMLGGMDAVASKNALNALGGIILALVGLIAAIGSISKFSDFASIMAIGDMLLKLSIAIGLMVVVVKMAAGLDQSEVSRGVGVVAAIELLFIAVIAVSKLAGENASEAGGMLLKMSAAVALMIGVIKLAAGLDRSEVNKGLGVVAAIEALFIAIIAVSKLAGENASKAGGMLLKMSIAMLLMIGVIKAAANLDGSELKNAIGVITIVGGVFAALIAVTKLAGRHADEAGSMLVKISVALLILTGVMFMLSLFKPEGLAKALGAIIILTACISALIAATGKAKSSNTMNKTLVLLMVTVGLMAGIVIGLSFIDPKRLATASASVIGLVGVFAALMVVTKYTKNTKDSRKSLVTMLGTVIVLAAVVAALSLIKDTDRALKSVAAVSILMLSLSAALAIMGKAGRISSTAKKTLLPMMGVVIGLASVLGIMSALDAEASISNATALGILLNTLATSLVILKHAGKNTLSSVGTLALMGLVVAELAAIMWALDALGVDVSIETALSLSALLLAMSAACDIVSMIPISAAATGAAGLAIFVGVIGGVIAALGGLSKIDGFAELMADGGKVLASIGYALGDFVGSIVGGFTSGATSGLPDVGTNLSGFMSNAAGFFEGAKNIDSKVLEGAGVVAGVIGLLTVASVLDGIASLVTFGGSFADLGTDLSDFMSNAETFINNASTLDKSMMEGVKALADTILTLTAAGVLDGLAALSPGSSSFESFATDLPLLAEGLAGFKTALGESGFTSSDLDAVSAAASAVKTLAQAASEIPNSGGWVGAIVGENDLDLFAAKFPKLAEGLVGFKNAMSEGEFTQADLASIEVAASAVRTLATVAQEIPNSGGWVGAIVGENDLDLFASKFPKLARGLVRFKNAMSEGEFTEEDLTAVETAASAVKTLSAVAQEIPNSGGWWAAIAGDNDLEDFADKFPEVGEGLAEFIEEIGTFGEEELATINYAVGAIKALADVANKINEDTTIWDAFNDDFIAFVNKLPTIGAGLAGFKTSAGGFTEDDAKSFAKAASGLKELAKISVSEIKIANISSFAASLPSIGSSMFSFITVMAQFSQDTVDANVQKVKTTCQTISEINAADVDNAFGKAKRFRDIAECTKGYAVTLGTISPDILAHSINAVQDMAQMMSGLVGIDTSGVNTFIKATETLATDGIKKFIETLSSTKATTLIDTAMQTLVDNAATVVSNSTETLTTAFSELAKAGVSAIENVEQFNAYKAAGAYLASGFAAGISAGTFNAKAKAAAMATAAKKAAEKALDINSPSKVFYQIGRFTAQGFANALYDNVGLSYDAAAEMANSAKGGLKKAISKIYDIVSNDMDAQPTIRPVLDLSEVEYGAGAINRMLAMNPSVGVLANVRSAGYMMNQRLQNGSNRDVVSAIDKLRGDISSKRGDTYNINGVTYDDGSNIAKAMKVIVREARISGRR